MRGVSGGDPADGARSGIPRRRLATARRWGTRPPATIRPGCEECAGTDPDVQSGEGKAPVRPKIATVERREASVSRETRAPHTRPGRAARHAPRVPQHPHVISALRHPSFRVREAKSKTRAQKRAAGTKKHVLFDK